MELLSAAILSNIDNEYFKSANRLIKNLTDLGIDTNSNYCDVKSGFYSTVFIIPDKKLVVKYFRCEPESKTIQTPNDSKYILQPLCHIGFGRSKTVAVFPMLNTEDVVEQHKEILRAGIESEGLRFTDNKLENIGLTRCGVPYVIDDDAVSDFKKEQLETNDRESFINEFGLKSQWELIDPIMKLDLLPKEDSIWSFSEGVKVMVGDYIHSPPAKKCIYPSSRPLASTSAQQSATL